MHTIFSLRQILRQEVMMRSNYKSDTPRDKSNVSDCNGCRKIPILLLVKRSTKMYMIYIYDHQD